MKLSAMMVLTFALVLSACTGSKKKEDNSKFDVQPLPGAPSGPVTSALPVITGNWKSVTPEPAGNGQYATREYSINLSRWEYTYTLAGDKDMKKTIYIFRAEGAYTIEAASNKIPGAFNINLRYSKKFLTLKSKSASVAKDLEFNTCHLTPNKEKDISNDGCSFFKAVQDCNQDYDVVKIENGMLRFGERPADNDMCTVDHRPETLASPLKKIN